MRFVVTVAVLAGALIVAISAFSVGCLVGEQEASNRRFQEESEALAPIIANDLAFSRVRIESFSGGGADMSGTVATREDLLRLRAAYVSAIGEARASGHFVVEVWPADRSPLGSGEREPVPEPSP